MATSNDDDYDNDDGYYDLELYFTIIIYWPNLHSISPSEGSLYITMFLVIFMITAVVVCSATLGCLLPTLTDKEFKSKVLSTGLSKDCQF